MHRAWGSVLIIVVACGSKGTEPAKAHALSAADLDCLGRVVQALELGDPADFGGLLAEAVGEVVIEDASCAAKFRRFPHTNPAERARQAQELWTACHLACPSEDVFAQLGSKSRAEAIAAIAADCDRHHPDPLAGYAGDDVADYLVIRNGLEITLARLEATRTAEAATLASKLRAMATRFAQVRVPDVRVPPADARVSAPVTKPIANRSNHPRGPRGRISLSAKHALGDSSLSVDAVVAKVRSVYMAGLKRCYRERLEVDAGLRGALELSLDVNAVGRTTGRATGVDAELDACLGQQMTNWRFPAPRTASGEPTTARFTLTLALAPD